MKCKQWAGPSGLVYTETEEPNPGYRNPKPRRSAKPFRRWSRDRFGCWEFDGEHVEASVVENLLNVKHVVLPAKVRR